MSAKRDLRTIFDLSTGDIHEVFRMAREMKEEARSKDFKRRLRGKILAMLFEKPSLRTRSTFEIAMTHDK